ncbi:integral membrane protein TmpA [Penicillium capsulatum]|uniref:Integral membrane protein TmpA n=1 Tax=Penicillium capsulatum TaxID=69766 RepID=A0A9W9LE89_9EURO|nr:integral membrane protein TmpA [Penicillium capsulatum]KAJ6114172.1 integral membrane protein TmpA [Penicillium capsulatum]
MSTAQRTSICIVVPPTATVKNSIPLGDNTFSDCPKKGKYQPSEIRFSDVEAQVVLPQVSPASFIRFITFTLYRRLFTLVFCLNAVIFVAVMTVDRKLVALANATATYLLVCGLDRQPLVINIFLTGPLPLRRIAAKAYHYSGVHSGCGIAAVIWYLGFVISLSHEYWSPSLAAVTISRASMTLAYTILALLAIIDMIAYPTSWIQKCQMYEQRQENECNGELPSAIFCSIDLESCAIATSHSRHEGDWTSDCIQRPPTRIWKQGVLIHDFAYAMRVFRQVVLVTTGSGSGPCLSFLGDENRPALRVLWQTRVPLKMYGRHIIDLPYNRGHRGVWSG